jgi:hypothetical protein
MVFMQRKCNYLPGLVNEHDGGPDNETCPVFFTIFSPLHNHILSDTGVKIDG